MAERCTTPSELCSSGRNPSRCAAAGLADRAEIRVLLVGGEGVAVCSRLRAWRRKRMTAEWARNALELRERAAQAGTSSPHVVFVDLELSDGEEAITLARAGFGSASIVALGGGLNGERAARLLGMGVPSLNKPVSGLALARLAARLSSAAANGAGSPAPPEGRRSCVNQPVGGLEGALESYAMVRALSRQQRIILRFYLSGKNDKQIAATCACSESTVYEHWRRMGKKAGGSAKADAISDFHRFLAAR